MDQIFPVQMSGSPQPGTGLKTALFPSGFRLGRIAAVLEPGKFKVVLENGVRVTAQGSRALKAGNVVRVFPPTDTVAGGPREKEQPFSPVTERGLSWTALLPLGFGGRKASARLQVFVQEKSKTPWDKAPRAVYFVVWTQTEKLGEVQWSIYLKGRQVSLQIYAAEGDKGTLEELVLSVETNLRRLGFGITGPTVFLRRPFKAPDGFRLNVRG